MKDYSKLPYNMMLVNEIVSEYEVRNNNKVNKSNQKLNDTITLN